MNRNLVVLCGTVTIEPTTRRLAGGTIVVHFDMSTSVERSGRSTTVSVPVAWHEPSSAALDAIGASVEVVVIGRVERRFFRVGGATQSRTEVVADHVVPSRRVKTVRSLLAAAVGSLTS